MMIPKKIAVDSMARDTVLSNPSQKIVTNDKMIKIINAQTLINPAAMIVKLIKKAKMFAMLVPKLVLMTSLSE